MQKSGLDSRELHKAQLIYQRLNHDRYLIIKSRGPHHGSVVSEEEFLRLAQEAKEIHERMLLTNYWFFWRKEWRRGMDRMQWGLYGFLGLNASLIGGAFKNGFDWWTFFVGNAGLLLFFSILNGIFSTIFSETLQEIRALKKRAKVAQQLSRRAKESTQ